MTTREKLIKIIKGNYEISTKNYYDPWTGDIEYTSTELNVEELADAILQSELFNEINKE